MTFVFGGFHGRALYELNGLPEHVRNGPLLERIIELLRDPWDAMAYPPGQKFTRQTFFGEHSEGLLTFEVDDEQGRLRFTDILWLG